MNQTLSARRKNIRWPATLLTAMLITTIGVFILLGFEFYSGSIPFPFVQIDNPAATTVSVVRIPPDADLASRRFVYSAKLIVLRSIQDLHSFRQLYEHDRLSDESVSKLVSSLQEYASKLQALPTDDVNDSIVEEVTRITDKLRSHADELRKASSGGTESLNDLMKTFHLEIVVPLREAATRLNDIDTIQPIQPILPVDRDSLGTTM